MTVATAQFRTTDDQLVRAKCGSIVHIHPDHHHYLGSVAVVLHPGVSRSDDVYVTQFPHATIDLVYCTSGNAFITCTVTKIEEPNEPNYGAAPPPTPPKRWFQVLNPGALIALASTHR